MGLFNKKDKELEEVINQIKVDLSNNYKDNAVEYGISEQYEAFGNQIISELNDQFGLSEEEALAIYKQPNRHYYTIELRKVLRGLGLPDK